MTAICYQGSTLEVSVDQLTTYLSMGATSGACQTGQAGSANRSKNPRK